MLTCSIIDKTFENVVLISYRWYFTFYCDIIAKEKRRYLLAKESRHIISLFFSANSTKVAAEIFKTDVSVAICNNRSIFPHRAQSRVANVFNYTNVHSFIHFLLTSYYVAMKCINLGG